jgi:hypothetical protein
MDNNSLIIKRPKRIGDEETEDELLKFQEEFLRNKKDSQPAAKVYRPNNNNNNNNSNNKNEIQQEKIDFDSDTAALRLVLTEIVEKSTKHSQIITTTPNTLPPIEKIDILKLKNENKTKKISLFAQNLKSKGKLVTFTPLNDPKQSDQLKVIEEKTKTITTTSSQCHQIGESLGNSNDCQQIHLENLKRLADMNEREILNEKEKLIKQLDPKLVSFIKNKNKLTKGIPIHFFSFQNQNKNKN